MQQVLAPQKMKKVCTILNEHKQKLGRPEYGISSNASTNVGRIAFDVINVLLSISIRLQMSKLDVWKLFDYFSEVTSDNMDCEQITC